MAKEAKKNKDAKNKKHFFKDFKAELKKVIWPTPKQIVNNTVAVVTIVVITAAIVFALDLAFDIFNEQGINRLKSNIKNKIIVENSVENNTDTQTTDNAVETENNETTSEVDNNQETVENESSAENENVQ